MYYYIVYRENTVRSVTRKKKIRIYAARNACGRWARLPSFAEHGYQLLFIYILFFLNFNSTNAPLQQTVYTREKFRLSLSLSLSLRIVISIYPTISMRPPQILL